MVFKEIKTWNGSFAAYKIKRNSEKTIQNL